MSWWTVQGTIATSAGTSGVVTFQPGARILQIIVSGGNGATIAVPNGMGGTATIPVPSSTSPWILIEGHLSRVMGSTQGGLTITFSGTASYFVEYIGAPGLS